jgi:type IV secretory pathway VirB4 component
LRENVEDTLASVVTWLVLRLVWNEIVASSDSRQPTHVIVDEAKYVLSYPGAARRLEGMARSFPKYLAALYLATQDMDSLLRSPESSVIANITQIKLFLKQENAEVVRGLGRIFQLSEAEQQDLLRVGKGEGLLVFDNGLRVPIYTSVNPLRLDWLSSNSAQQQAVARASGRRSQPVR